MKPKIVVTGSYNVGLVMKTGKLPVWGETGLAEGFSEGPGGKGSNQAVAVARLGGRSCFVGCVGEDRYGDQALEMLAAERVDIAAVKRTDLAKTGAGFVILNRSGDNCILVDPGANRCMTPEDIDAIASVYEGAAYALFQLEMDKATVLHAMKTAAAKGARVILNPAPALPDIGALLRHATIVTPNESELKTISGIDASVSIELEHAVDLARALLDHGPEAVVVTRGEHGATIVRRHEVIHIRPPKVEPVDTTGAGDSFSAALAVALGEGQTLEAAARFACFVGAYTVTGREVIPALPTREQVEAFMQAKASE